MGLHRRLAALLTAAVLTACGAHVAPAPPSSGTLRLPQSISVANAGACEQQVNDTLAKVERCIQRATLWQKLSRFQQIADAHPGPDGHGNRDTGTPGYRASVEYVAALMRGAGYRVTVQPYTLATTRVRGTPVFETAGHAFAFARDWFVARRSGAGAVTARVQPPAGDGDGCSQAQFAGFTRGNIALIARGACSSDEAVVNATAAGASAVVIFDSAPDGAAENSTAPHEARLTEQARVPVIADASNAVGSALLAQYRRGDAPVAHIAIATEATAIRDFNVIAESPIGDPDRTVVIDAHLDSIYGAGMLDNASGSATILEVALAMAKTPALHRLRYVWFGGEELGLFGSHYYTTHLSKADLARIAFDIDVDVTATPNFDVLVADPANAFNVGRFPPNVVPQSKLGNGLFEEFFRAGGVISRPARFGNDGTDSNSFSLAGVPNSGILTNQDCCKRQWETQLWGGFLGNYEGDVPSFDGGCVDRPNRWCDNLSNNDPFIFELVSKGVAYVTYRLAEDPSLPR